MIRRAPHVEAAGARGFDRAGDARLIGFERDVQIEIVLFLELERRIRNLEKRDERAIVQSEERVQRPHGAAGLRRSKFERRGQRQADHVLVEGARLFGIAAPKRHVMKRADHGSHTVLSSGRAWRRPARSTAYESYPRTGARASSASSDRHWDSR
jgi:hypothetical protein